MPVGAGAGAKPGAGGSGNGVLVPNPAAVTAPATNAMQEANGGATAAAAGGSGASSEVGDALTTTVYAGTEGSRQRWGEERDDSVAAAGPEPQGRRVLQRYQRWGEERDEDSNNGGGRGARVLQEASSSTGVAGAASTTVGDAVTSTVYAGTDGRRQRWGEERDDAPAPQAAQPEPQGRRRV